METIWILVWVILLGIIGVLLYIRESVWQRRYQRLSIELAKAQQLVEHTHKDYQNRNAFLETENKRLRVVYEREHSEHQETQKKLARIQAFYQSQQEKIEEQKTTFVEMKNHFNKEFELIAARILEEKTEKFSISHSRSLDQILHPFKERIKNFEEKVDKVYKMEADERHTLKGVIHTLVEQTKQIQQDANNLTRALKGDQKKQGNWGEVILERILERSGLEKDREYRIQTLFNDEDGNRLQPDVVIDLPDQKHLIIDAKVSLVAYEQWVNADTEAEKKLFSKQHITSVRHHIAGLSSKNYCDLYEIQSPDFVLLFIPIESSFSLSVSEDTEIFNYAWDKRVVLVSPSTLLATLRTIAGLWKQDKQNKNVIEIAREAGLLYDKFVGFIDDMDKIEKQITALSKTHDNARKKLDTGKGNLVSRIEKLKILGANTSKQLNTFSSVDPAQEENTISN